MNWEAIGAVGEVVGAIAVVATLVYFGRQLRSATLSAEASNMRGVADRFNLLGLEIAKNPDLRRVYQKALESNSIDEFSVEDRLILELVLRGIFNNVHAGTQSSELFGFQSSALADGDQGFEWLTRTLLSYPIIREWWRDSPLKDHSYGPTFEKVVNAAIAEHEQTPPND